MRTTIRTLGAGAVAVIALAGCGGGGDDGGGEASTVTVSVDDNVFEPETVEISAGDTVVWEWVGVEPHDVSADEFDSEIQTEGSFEHTFEDAGSFPYTCTVHPGMEGTVEVT